MDCTRLKQSPIQRFMKPVGFLPFRSWRRLPSEAHCQMLWAFPPFAFFVANASASICPLAMSKTGASSQLSTLFTANRRLQDSWFICEDRFARAYRWRWCFNRQGLCLVIVTTGKPCETGSMGDGMHCK